MPTRACPTGRASPPETPAPPAAPRRCARGAAAEAGTEWPGTFRRRAPPAPARSGPNRSRRGPPRRDRKSTRLNSSHLVISYAVFCLKKKKKTRQRTQNIRIICENYTSTTQSARELATSHVLLSTAQSAIPREYAYIGVRRQAVAQSR